MSAIVSAEQLCVAYGRRGVLSDVDFELASGELVVLVGANGSGKSSLLRVLSGRQPATSGRVVTHGRVLLIDPAPPPPDVTPFDLASYGLYIRSPWWLFRLQDDDRESVTRALSRAGLADRARDPMSELSAGEMQRAWIAAAIAGASAAILIDEATSHLDVRYQIEVLQTLRDLASAGLSLIAALHDLTLAARFADRVALLSSGTLVAGPPAEILTPDLLTRAFGTAMSTFEHPVTGRLICAPSA